MKNTKIENKTRPISRTGHFGPAKKTSKNKINYGETKMKWEKSKYPNVDVLIDDFEDVKIEISYHNTKGKPIKFNKNSREAIKRVVHQVRVLNKIGKSNKKYN
tara:strand:+ start:22 stop:330 length:309 start_codon:yes stop_codon:yes gene_type:complete